MQGISEDSADAIARTPHHHAVGDVLAALQTHAESGLDPAEAARRLARYGRNELATTAPRPTWRKFLDQFTSLLVILLLVAAAISAGLWLY